MDFLPYNGLLSFDSRTKFYKEMMFSFFYYFLRITVYCYHTGCYWQGLYLSNIPGDLRLHCGTVSYHY